MYSFPRLNEITVVYETLISDHWDSTNISTLCQSKWFYNFHSNLLLTYGCVLGWALTQSCIQPSYWRYGESKFQSSKREYNSRNRTRKALSVVQGLSWKVHVYSAGQQVPRLYESQRFIAMFTDKIHGDQYRASPYQHTLFLKIRFNNIIWDFRFSRRGYEV
jgi:hypothetical protein